MAKVDSANTSPRRGPVCVNIRVVITVMHGNPDPRRSVRDLASRVDGIVVHGNALDLATIQDLRGARVPVVLVAHAPVAGCDSVPVHPGDILLVETPGGGGYGAPE